MNIQKRNGDCPPPDNGGDDCKDKDNATQKSITSERMAICTLLYETEGNVEQQQTKFDGENGVFNDKEMYVSAYGRKLPALQKPGDMRWN